MILATSAEHGLWRDVVNRHDGRIHGGEVNLCHVLENPQFRLKDETSLICDKEIPCRLESFRLSLSPGNENPFLKGPVELHGRNGRSRRGAGHPLNWNFGQTGQFDHSLYP